MRIIFLGAPGSGKGTQAEKISRILDIPTISTGETLRAAIREKTAVGLEAKPYMDDGQLVPDKIIIDIIAHRLAKPDCMKGYILDGVPRTIAQAKAFDNFNIKFDHVIYLESPDKVILERLRNRRVCDCCGSIYHLITTPPKTADICDLCGGILVQRSDDLPETVNARLKIYHRETAPLIDHYRALNILRTINLEPTIEETTRAILRTLERISYS